MLQTDAASPPTFDRADSFERGRELRTRLTNPQGYHEEILPFTVRLVHDDVDLNKAVQIRHSAYARHLPQFAETLKVPEREDTENGVTVLLAESKLDGSPLGSMRIQTNQFKPLCLEQSIQLPDWLQGKHLAEATRLGVTDGKGGRLVTTVLFKAFYLYCEQIGTDWMVITGRSPIDRQYERMLFTDIFPGIGYVPLAHVGNLPHRVMASEVATAKARWTASNNPLFDFAFRTHHPDIQVAERRRALLNTQATAPISPVAPLRATRQQAAYRM
jgi:hypothetical protein